MWQFVTSHLIDPSNEEAAGEDGKAV